MQTLTPDELAEIAHAPALHYEDAYDAALALAETELRTGACRPRLSGEGDGHLLPARGYAFLAAAPQGLVRIAVLPAGGNAFTATVSARYVYAVAELGEGTEDGDHCADVAAALARAVALSERRRGRVYEVYALAGGRVALVFDGEVYARQAH